MWKMVIIDDDPQVVDGLKTILPWEELSIELSGDALDGQEGLELIRAVKPDIIITDIYMPLMDGLEMIQRLTATNEFVGKCIILSGYSDFEYARKALRLRVDEYLSKPISSETIKQVLKRITFQLDEERLQQLEQREIQNKLTAYEPVIMREWLRTVVIGSVKDEQFRNYPAKLKQQWHGKRHLVCVLAMHQRNTGQKSLADWHLLRFAASKAVDEIASDFSMEVNWIELYSHHAALLIHFDDCESWDEFTPVLKEMAVQIIRFVSTYLQTRVAIGVGKPKKEWHSIEHSTSEAMQALNELESSLNSDLQVAFFNEGTSSSAKKESRLHSLLFHQQLAEAVRYTRTNEVEKLIDSYFGTLQGKGIQHSLEKIRLIGIEIWTVITYSLHEGGVTVADIFPQMDLGQELEQVLFIDELKQWLKGKIAAIWHDRQWEENIKHRQAIKATIEYIHDQYHDPNIALQTIAEEVHLSRNYLGQLFSKAVGESFKSYLTRIRMEKAKQLLLEGKLLVYEVAFKVGYSHVPYFTKQFKNCIGCSPTELMNRKVVTKARV